MTHGLLVSHRGERCGVQQFGRRLFETLRVSPLIQWAYAECASIEEFLAAAATYATDVVVLNFHPATLVWAQDLHVRSCGVPCMAIYHEAHQYDVDCLESSVFQFLLCPDPTLLPRNPMAIAVPRFIPPVRAPAQTPDGEFSIGSFGFATPGKGFPRLCHVVNAQFDCARIRLNIPPHDIDELVPQTTVGALVAECRRQITKSGVTLEITDDFMSEEVLLDFLSRNTINAFLYDECPNRGISSCTDYALASGRPLAISNSTMFRNLQGINPSISVEHRGLREIAETGVEPLRHHVAHYSREASSLAWNSAILDALKQHKMSRSVPDGRGFNKILDDRSRSAYGHALDELRVHAPDLLERKIERANIQQAFTLDAVERLVAEYFEPRILAVGSFEDTTVAVLRSKGYRLDEVDPNVNQLDLEAFVEARAIAGSYDVILCVSVLEHVADDQSFVRSVADLLTPGGVAVFTVDFSNRFPITRLKPSVDYRLYTSSDIQKRLMWVLPDCVLLDSPTWDDAEDDFIFEGCRYSFASWTFRKFNSGTRRYATAELISQKADAGCRLRALLAPHGEIYDGMFTIIGDRRIEGGIQVFACDGTAEGYIIYGPYCACPAGDYQCTFLVNVFSSCALSDTEIVMIDTAVDTITQGPHRTFAYGEFSPGTFSIISFQFNVPTNASHLETRLRLLHPIPITVAASVAIQRLNQQGLSSDFT